MSCGELDFPEVSLIIKLSFSDILHSIFVYIIIYVYVYVYVYVYTGCLKTNTHYNTHFGSVQHFLEIFC